MMELELSSDMEKRQNSTVLIIIIISASEITGLHILLEGVSQFSPDSNYQA